MKAKYKPIAMRCNQEQFTSISNLIPLPFDIFGFFKEDTYLTNNYVLDKEVGITTNPYKEGREVIETFDGKYFLECCGVEVLEDVSEQTWKGSDMQYKRIDDNGNDWFDCLDFLEYRLKPKTKLDADIEALYAKAKELGIEIEIITK